MDRAPWTYELPPVGADSEGLEEYEARSADGAHVGIVQSMVARAGRRYVVVDRSAMPPLTRDRLAVPWEAIEEVDHDALVVWLRAAKEGLDEAGVPLDPHKALHGPGAEAVRVTRLPRALMRPARPGVEGPSERWSAVPLALLVALAPFSLLGVTVLWATRGLAGWEYGLLGLPFALGAIALLLEGYRLYREPHVGRPSRREPRQAAGTRRLALFALSLSVVYLTVLLGITLGFESDLPALAWVGFAVVTIVVFGIGLALAGFLVSSSREAGAEPVRPRPLGEGGRRVLVVADEACRGEEICGPLARRLRGRPAEVLVVAPALVSPLHYLDSDLDDARAAARARLDQTVASLEATGLGARGHVGSESPLEAIADALAEFPADEIVIATPPPERSNWLEEDLVDRAHRVSGVPVSHLVVGTRT